MPQPVTSSDVNDYIRDATSGEFTAKHFRTWAASVIFYEQLLAKEEDRRLSLRTALEPVAEALGNTVAISRKSYVHPKLIEALQEHPDDPLGPPAAQRARRRLSAAESGFLKFLRRRRRASAGKAAA